MKILITRPHADAEELAKPLKARGHEVLFAPLLEIVFSPGDPIAANGTQALLFTSANGVRALIARNANDLSALRHLPVYTVGDATGRAAQEAGLAEVLSASGDVKALAALVISRMRPDAGPLLHIATSDAAGDLSGLLAAEGFTVTRAVLYEARKTDALSPETSATLRRGDIPVALFFSPRTATAFVALATAADLAPALGRTTAICLSSAVADAIDELPGAASWRDILTAAEPTQDALLSALDHFVDRETRPKAAMSAAPLKSAPSPWTMDVSTDEAPAEASPSPLPPPIYSDSSTSAASSLPPVSSQDRVSWQIRLALAIVALLLIGGVALYLAKPAALRTVFPFEWLNMAGAKLTLQSPPSQADGAAPTVQPFSDTPSDSAAEIDALRHELSLTTARLMEAQREPIVRSYEVPPDVPADASAETSPELLLLLDDLETRLGRLAVRPAASETRRYATDVFSARLTLIDETLSALTQKLEGQTTAQEAERARAARAQTLTFGALALRESLDRGTPFVEATVDLRPLAQEMGLAAQFDFVQLAAAKGFAASDELRDRLMALSASVRRAEAGTPDSGLLARLWRSMTSAVVVRRVAADDAILNAADPADRLLSRAERRLAAGDLADAIAPAQLLTKRESLPADLRVALDAWIADARARAAADQLAAALLQRGLAMRSASGAPR